MNNMNPVAYGLITAIIGMLVVFAMLTILIVAIMILSAFVRKATEKKENKSAAAAPAPAPAPAPVVEEVVEEEEVMDEEIIAVIAAAIAAFDQTNAKLVVRSVRRKGAWGKASREEQVYRF